MPTIHLKHFRERLLSIMAFGFLYAFSTNRSKGTASLPSCSIRLLVAFAVVISPWLIRKGQSFCATITGSNFP